MTLTVRRATAADLLALEDLDPATGFDPEWLDEDEYVASIVAGDGLTEAWAVLDEQGPVGVLGYDIHHGQDVEAWAIFGRRWRRNARAITELVRAELDTSRHKSLFIRVLDSFTAGHRWAEALGFIPAMGDELDGQPATAYIRPRKDIP